MSFQAKLLWCTVSIHLIAGVISTQPSTPRRCANARKPANGDVRCGCYGFDQLLYGSKSSKSGSKSSESGSRSKGPDVYTCRYSCNQGYMLNGPSVLECPFDVADNPTCTRDQCEALPLIDHGALNCSNGFLYQSECQYTCAPGFNTSAGSNTLTCGSDGLWSSAVPKCLPVQCPPLMEPHHGTVLCPNGRSFQSDCRYTCDDRYVLDGLSILTCSDSGQWIGQPPKCQLGECVPLPFLVHGSLTCNKGWDNSSRCFYFCHRGFRLKGGNHVLTCRTNGYWRGSIPTCVKGKSSDDYVYYDTYVSDNASSELNMESPLNMESYTTSSGLSTAGIISLLAVAIIIASIGVGLFVAYRLKKHARGRNLLNSTADTTAYQSVE